METLTTNKIENALLAKIKATKEFRTEEILYLENIIKYWQSQKFKKREVRRY